MAQPSLCPADAGASSHLAAASVHFVHPAAAADAAGAESSFAAPADRLALLQDVQLDAERTHMALAAVVALLRGCAPGHQLSAGGLLCLLEPIAGGLDTLCGDLGAVVMGAAA